ncbi:MAG: peptidoglycan-binding protein [Actinomycetota bacterium]
MDRRKLAAIVIGVVVATSVGGFAAGSRITSPAEIASRTAAPPPAPILVPVEERVLSTDVVTRGTGRFGSPQKLSVATSALKSNAGLIAELPLAGAELVEGDVAVSASGRPMFVLVGSRPMSRDLGPGLTGDDVGQLEDSLTRLGFDVGPPDGVYDEATEAAVTAWYSENGFAPFTATEGQLSAVRARESELAAASVDVVAATDQVAAAESALRVARAAAAAAVRRAEATARAVDRARAEATVAATVTAAEIAALQATLDTLRAGRPATPGTPAEIRVAEADLASARANESAVRASGLRAVAEAQTALDQAPARLASATVAASTADAAAAADVAARQASLDAVIADPSSTEVQLALARADLAAAQATASNVHVAGLQAIADAQAALDAAPGALAAARSQASAADAVAAAEVAAKQAVLSNLSTPVAPTPSEIAAAERQLTVAKANGETVRLAGERAEDDATSAATEALAEVALNAASARAAETAVATATLAAGSRSQVVDRAALEADLARRRAGVQVPADEVVFVAVGPVRVSNLLVVIGDPAIGGIMTVTDALVHVDGALAVEDAGLVVAGMKVQVAEPDLGIDVEGVVATVAAAPGTNGVDGFHVYFAIDVEAPPPNLVGASVRLTIPVESSGGTVLVVPLSALTLAADGSSRVQRSVGGVTELVAVKPGLSADGYVEVAGILTALEVGDLVVIGFAPTDITTGATGG